VGLRKCSEPTKKQPEFIDRSLFDSLRYFVGDEVLGGLLDRDFAGILDFDNRASPSPLVDDFCCPIPISLFQ
jgi:hypothetical protein